MFLNEKSPKDKPIFTFNFCSTVLVNDNFKKLVEQNNLKGFDFSIEYKVYPE